MTGLWTSIPIGTVPQRPRPAAASAVTAGPAVAARPAPYAPLPAAATVPAAPLPAPTEDPGLDAVTATLAPAVPVDDMDAPTGRLAADALAARHAATTQPAPARVTSPPTVIGRQPPTWGPPPSIPLPRSAAPVTPRATVRWLPLLALVALLAVAVSVLVPWSGTADPWVASQPVGLALLAVTALLTIPVTIDLLAGRVRGSALVIGLPLMAGAALLTVAVAAPGRGGSLAATAATQGLDSGVSAAPSALGVALVLCLVVGIVATVRFLGDRRRATSGGAAAVVVAVCAGVSLAAVSALVIVLVAPGPQVATVAAGSSRTDAGSSPGVGGTSSASPTCPAEAAATLPVTGATAVVVGHSARVHVALCRVPSGALYYYGANDSTHLTITLPATRSEDSWIMQNNGVTYYLTEDHLSIDRGAVSLADENLTAGWTR